MKIAQQGRETAQKVKSRANERNAKLAWALPSVAEIIKIHKLYFSSVLPVAAFRPMLVGHPTKNYTHCFSCCPASNREVVITLRWSSTNVSDLLTSNRLFNFLTIVPFLTLSRRVDAAMP